MNRRVIMPERLTAEIGAKYLLTHEVFVSTQVQCLSCRGRGCEACHGSGEYTLNIPVDWTAIKAIYNLAVEHFGEPYAK